MIYTNLSFGTFQNDLKHHNTHEQVHRLRTNIGKVARDLF
jgi:hypothetical protein